MPECPSHTDPERFFTKEAASAANIYIYGQHFAAEEGETSIMSRALCVLSGCPIADAIEEAHLPDFPLAREF